jgi:hypothetical protein
LNVRFQLRRYKSFMGGEVKRSKEELIAEIQSKVAYLIATDDYTAEEKEAIARRFFQALEEEE